MGFASATHFAVERLDMKRRTARDLIAVGRALAELPLVDCAFAEGRISWTKLRLLARICVPETQSAWLEKAESLSLSEFERLASTSEAGRPPRESGHGLPVTKVDLRLRLNVVEHELLEQVRLKVVAETGEEISTRDVVLLLGERYLKEQPEGDLKARTEAAGESLFRVHVDHCPSCRESRVRTLDGPVPIPANLGDALLCEGKRSEAEPPARGAAAPRKSEVPMTFAALPQEVDAAWWRRHQRLLKWNDRRGVFLLEEGVADDEAVARPRHEAPPTQARFEDILDQDRVVESLKIALEAARIEGRRPDPILLTGPAGGGKTTLARATAQGSRMTTITLRLADFVTVAATTDPDRMPRPLRDRFTHQEVLDVHGEDDLALLAERTADRLERPLTEGSARLLARVAHGTPRRLIALVRCGRDVAVARSRPAIDIATVRDALCARGIDEGARDRRDWGPGRRGRPPGLSGLLHPSAPGTVRPYRRVGSPA